MGRIPLPYKAKYQKLGLTSVAYAILQLLANRETMKRGYYVGASEIVSKMIEESVSEEDLKLAKAMMQVSE